MPDFFSRPVVCNTGPLIGLGRAGLAHLPGRIFPSVLVPETVVSELLAGVAPDAGGGIRDPDREDERNHGSAHR